MPTKKISIGTFVLLVYLPILLSLTYRFSGIKLDVETGGYVDEVSEPEISMAGYVDGQFQTQYEAWYDAVLLPKGVLTKLHNQIQYSAFRLAQSSVVIGGNYNLLNEVEITEYLGRGVDYSSIDDEYNNVYIWINQLMSIQEKLQRFDKQLLVYIAPAKVSYYGEDIPYRYRVVSTDVQRAVDYLRDNIRSTGIEFIDYVDVVGEDYPVFYKSGEHWSCTAEQEMGRQIIKSLEAMSGKRFRMFEMDKEVQQQKEPFYSETDMLDLINIYSGYRDEYFYKYQLRPTYPDSFDGLSVLVQGDSFGETLTRFCYRGDEIHRLFYNNYYVRNNGGLKYLDGDFDNIDLGEILDQVDFVIIECQECLLSSVGGERWEFADYLDKYLDTYVPSEDYKQLYPERLDINNESFQEYSYSGGFYGDDNGELLVGDDFSYVIKNELVKDRGMRIVMSVQNLKWGGYRNNTSLCEWNKNGTKGDTGNG